MVLPIRSAGLLGLLGFRKCVRGPFLAAPLWCYRPRGRGVGGGCRSGWGRLLSVTNAIEPGTCLEGDVAGHRLGALEGGGGTSPPSNASLPRGASALRVLLEAAAEALPLPTIGSQSLSRVRPHCPGPLPHLGGPCIRVDHDVTSWGRASLERGGGVIPSPPPNTPALTLPQRHSHTPTPAPTAFPTASNRPPQPLSHPL